MWERERDRAGRQAALDDGNRTNDGRLPPPRGPRLPRRALHGVPVAQTLSDRDAAGAEGAGRPRRDDEAAPRRRTRARSPAPGRIHFRQLDAAAARPRQLRLVLAHPERPAAMRHRRDAAPRRGGSLAAAGFPLAPPRVRRPTSPPPQPVPPLPKPHPPLPFAHTPR